MLKILNVLMSVICVIVLCLSIASGDYGLSFVAILLLSSILVEAFTTNGRLEEMLFMISIGGMTVYAIENSSVFMLVLSILAIMFSVLPASTRPKNVSATKS